MKNNKFIFVGIALFLIGGFLAASKIYKKYEGKRLNFLGKENFEIFVRDYSPILGPKDAKVYVIEFLDPECESCRALYPAVKQLLKQYEGKVRLVVRYAAFHKNSKIAISALEASRKQNKYWESLELLLKYQPRWGDHHNPQPNLIFDYLPEVGVDVTRLQKDMQDPQILKIIEQDGIDLKQLNVRGTPTFFVNGKALAGFGIKYLKQAIDSEIQKHY